MKQKYELRTSEWLVLNQPGLADFQLTGDMTEAEDQGARLLLPKDV